MPKRKDDEVSLDAWEKFLKDDVTRGRFQFTSVKRRAVVRIITIAVLHIITFIGPIVFRVEAIFPILAFGFAYVVTDSVFILKPFAKDEDKKEFRDRTSNFGRKLVYLFLYVSLILLTLTIVAWFLEFTIDTNIYFVYLLFTSLVLGAFWGTGFGVSNLISDYLSDLGKGSWWRILLNSILLFALSLVSAILLNVSIIIPITIFVIIFLIITRKKWTGRHPFIQASINIGYCYGPYVAIFTGILGLLSQTRLMSIVAMVLTSSLATGAAGVFGVLVSFELLQTDRSGNLSRMTHIANFHRFTSEITRDIFGEQTNISKNDKIGLFFATLPMILVLVFLVGDTIDSLPSLILFLSLFFFMFLVSCLRPTSLRLNKLRNFILASAFLIEILGVVPVVVLTILVSFLLDLGNLIIFNVAWTFILSLSAIYLGEYIGRLAIYPIVRWLSIKHMNNGFAVIRHTAGKKYGKMLMLIKVPLETKNLTYTVDHVFPPGSQVILKPDIGKQIHWGPGEGLLEVDHLLFCPRLDLFKYVAYGQLRAEFAESLKIIPPKKWISRGLHALRTEVREGVFMKAGLDSKGMNIPKLEKHLTLEQWIRCLELMRESARTLGDLQRRVQNAWILDTLDLTNYWDQAYDTLKIALRISESVEDVSQLKSELEYILASRLESHLKKRRSTHFLDIESMERNPAFLGSIHDIVKYREAEFKNMVLVKYEEDNEIDLRPLWLTARGFALLSKTELGHTIKPAKLGIISGILNDFDIDLKIKKGKFDSKKLPKTWTRMSKTQKQFILYLARPELRHIL